MSNNYAVCKAETILKKEQYPITDTVILLIFTCMLPTMVCEVSAKVEMSLA